ncbi:MAG: hypothetical protein K2J80_03820 [Oscillospiraceae bacterium]|nr:hypothetical protein [Oscillospiraceae bacterium]
MKKTKRAIAAIASAALILALAGCQNTSTPGVPATSEAYSSPSPIESMASGASGTAQNTSNPEQSEPESSGGVPHISAEATSIDTSYTPPNNSQVGEITEGILVLDGGQGIMLYGMEWDIGRSHAAAINKYKEQLGENVNVFSMIVPTQLSFYLPERYSDLSDGELAHIKDVNKHFSGIIPIDAFSALKDHVGEDIYYRTDHHWTQLGAYYAAKSFAETALVPFDNLLAYEKHEKDGYLGSFYGGSNEHPEIKNNPETFMWFVPKRKVTTTYYDQKCENGYEGSYFFEPEDFNASSQWLFTYMSGDGNVVHVKTELDTGRRLMILKDSYADSFAPCLFGSFDDIWIADIRFCGISTVELAKDKGITDLLFCCSAYSAVGDNRYKLEDIQHKLEEIM